ncbi:MAG: class I adenylate-forming enzyme family protein [Zwartia sp.]
MNTTLLSELEGLTVGRALRRSAAKWPEQEFFKSQDTSLTFTQFDRLVDQLAQSLLALGLTRHDHIAVWLGNSLEWTLCFCACARIGAVVVPINTRYTAAEAGYILAQSDAKALILSKELYGLNYLQMLEHIAPSLKQATHNLIDITELPALKRVILHDASDDRSQHDENDHTSQYSIPLQILLQQASARDALRIAFARPTTGDQSVPPPTSDLSNLPLYATEDNGLVHLTLAQAYEERPLHSAEQTVIVEDVLLICYTSGTTGKPKGVMHNHRVLKQATRVGIALDLKPGGRMLGHMPLYHVAGLYMGFVPALTLGACFVNMPQWDTGRALELLEQERITAFGGIPTHFVDLVNHPTVGQRDLSSIENAWIGGSPVMQATFENFQKTLGLKQLMSTYGMTENTISTSFNRLTDPLEVCCQNRAPILGPSEVKIIDPVNGNEQPRGEVGEIWCRGETVMLGYYKNPEATQATITPEGWLKTGDLGRFDSEGFLSVTGRLKEMYKTGGTNVYPAEIEQLLIQHPAIALVAIVGVPDLRLDEVGFAFVQTHPNQQITHAELRAFCKGKLAAYKVPRYLKTLAAIPRTTTGKIQRSALLELASVELALAAQSAPG